MSFATAVASPSSGARVPPSFVAFPQCAATGGPRNHTPSEDPHTPYNRPSETNNPEPCATPIDPREEAGRIPHDDMAFVDVLERGGRGVLHIKHGIRKEGTFGTRSIPLGVCQRVGRGKRLCTDTRSCGTHTHSASVDPDRFEFP